MPSILPSVELSRRRLLQSGIALGGTAFVLTACGDDESPDTDTEASPGLAIAAAGFGFEQFDPIVDPGFDVGVLTTMYECPVEVDEAGQLAPGIVTEWEPSADGTAWTLKMRDDVVFHDGTKCTADDLAFAYVRSVEPDAGTNGDMLPLLGEEPNVEVVDPTTVVVHTNGVQALLIPFSTVSQSVIWLVPKAYIEENGKEHFNENPIGTGPYKFTGYVTGQTVDMEAVDYTHWRITPEFKTIQWRAIENEQTQIASLQAGEVDAISASPTSMKPLTDGGFNVQKGVLKQAYMGIIGAYDPEYDGPFKDVRVRQALSYAIDRQQIADAVYPDFNGFPGPVRLASIMPDMTEELWAKWSSWCEENYAYDPDKAKQLLADAGFADGFEFDVISRTDNALTPGGPQTAQAAASFWEAIGLKPKQVPMTSDALSEITNPATTKDGLGKVFITASSLPKPSGLQNMTDVFIEDGSIDFSYGAPWHDHFQELTSEGYATVDPVRSEEILDELITLAQESFTGMSVYELTTAYAFSDRVEPVLSPSAVAIAQTVAYWKYAGE